jgi:hypothetical protein
MIGRHVPLIAPEDVHRFPVDAISRSGEKLEESARRRAAGEHEGEAAVRVHRFTGEPHDLFRGGPRDLVEIRQHAQGDRIGHQGFRHLRPSLSISSSASFGPQLPAA